MAATNTSDVIVIGAGIAGLSAASELARACDVVVLEQESQPAYHSTGRSAAILAQTYGSGVIRSLTAASARFFETPPDGFSETPLLSPRGLARIATRAQESLLRDMFDELLTTKYLVWLEEAELRARVPLLRPGYAIGGFFNASAQDIDVHAMVTGYQRNIRRDSGRIRADARVETIARDGANWRVSAGSETFSAPILVNAAGAWADGIARMAGVRAKGLEPRRRSAITFDAPEGTDPASFPMVVDAEETFYLKPEAGRFMASPADETLSEACDSRPEEIDIAICVDRISTAFDLEIRRIRSSWAGLRTFARDRAPVCGFDADAKGFFWLAGQGGYGVQTAPAVSRLAAAMIAGRDPDDDIKASGLSLDDILPGRKSLAP